MTTLELRQRRSCAAAQRPNRTARMIRATTTGFLFFDSFRIDADACIENELTCHGLITLHTGVIRALGLTVIRDPSDGRKLLIPDMPLANPGDAAQEALLDAVADSARIVKKCKWRKPD